MDINGSNQQITNVQLPNQQQQQQQQQQRKKCHGNRRNQRFRRKCREQKMNPTKIEKLIKKRNRINKKHQRKNQHGTNGPNQNKQQQQTTTLTNLNKRKRDISLQQLSTKEATENQTITKSLSQLSIERSTSSLSSSVSKRIKNTTTTMDPIMESDNNATNNYRRPMYLTRSSSVLDQIINKTFNDSIKTINEKRFLYTRLRLLDEQYCLQTDQQLWQSYLDIGLQQHTWPDQLYAMTKTNDFELCKNYLMHYIETIKRRLNQCQMNLTKQSSQPCPITKLSFDEIDYGLEQLVHRERKYLSTRNNEQLIQFKDDIAGKNLFKTISTCSLINNQQKESMNRLIAIREKQAEIWKEQSMLQTRILCKFLPENLNDLQNFIASITYLPLNNNQKSIDIKNHRYKIIHETKDKWLNHLLNAYEIKMIAYDSQYQYEFIKLESQFLNNTLNNSTTTTTAFSYIKEYINSRISKDKQDIIHQMSSSFRRVLLQNRQRSSSTKDTVGVSPESYLDLMSNPFDTRQWNQLSLGPLCIRSNQSAIRPRCQQESKIKDEHKDISGKLEKYLVEHWPIMRQTNSIFKEYSDHLRDYLNQCYFTPLSYKDQLLALEQAQIFQSIRQIIRNMNLIIRITDKGHNFYIGSASEFEKKVDKFFSETNAFIELSYNPYNEILDKVNELLEKLQSKKLILQWQYKLMKPNPEKTELPHLYFNPKTHKEGIPVRPIENMIRAPTKNISKFLDEVLRHIFDDKCQKTTIIDGSHLCTELHSKYIKKGLLKSTTLFCTIDIRNLYTMLPQDEALNILMEFLNVHGYRKVKGINLDTIRKLASIVLKENAFAYGTKLYKQTTGGAMGSSFTLTLANIFMWKWQKKFVDQQDSTGEFFGRYIDDIFITWNQSEEALIKFIDEANNWQKNIKLDYKISKSLPYLDVLLINNNGILETSVYHKSAAEPYVIPFISDHPRHTFVNIIKTSLTRAVRYSSTFKAFNYERRHIKLTLLYNGYPSTFIDNEFHKFFFEYGSTSPFLPLITDEKQFFRMRQAILGQATQRQSQVALSAAIADIDNDETDEQVMEKEKNTTATNKRIYNKDDRFVVHYTHEKRFQSLKRDMHHLYEETFGNTPAIYSKFIVGNQNRRNAQHELIRKRPKKTLLHNIFTQKQQKKKNKRLTATLPTAQIL